MFFFYAALCSPKHTNHSRDHVTTWKMDTTRWVLMPDLKPLPGKVPTDAMATANGWPRLAEPVLHPANLTSFLRWAHAINTDPKAVREVLEDVYVITHVNHDQPMEPIHLMRKRGTLKYQKCRQDGCPRCPKGMGGYVFPFVDPRWTTVHMLTQGLDNPTAMAKLERMGPGQRLPMAADPSNRADIFDDEGSWLIARQQVRPPCSAEVNQQAFALRTQMALRSVKEDGYEDCAVMLHGRVIQKGKAAGSSQDEQ